MEYITGELASRSEIINSCAALKNLDDGLLSFDLKYLALSLGAVSETNIYYFCILWEFDIVEDDQWADYIKDSSVVNTWGDIVVCGDSCYMLL